MSLIYYFFMILILAFLFYTVESLFGTTGIILLTIVFVALGGWCIYYLVKLYKLYRTGKKNIEQSKKEIDTLLNKKYGNSHESWNIGYLGGHSSFNYSNPLNCYLKLYNDVMVLVDYSSESYAEICYKDITDIEVMTKEHITKSPTLSKFLLFGVASLAMQKESIHYNQYVVISYNDNGIKSKLILNSSQAGKIWSTINRYRVQYNEKHGIMPEIDQSINDNNIIEQIRELAKLRDENIITEDEFQDKKKELLSKM